MPPSGEVARRMWRGSMEESRTVPPLICQPCGTFSVNAPSLGSRHGVNKRMALPAPAVTGRAAGAALLRGVWANKASDSMETRSVRKIIFSFIGKAVARLEEFLTL